MAFVKFERKFKHNLDDVDGFTYSKSGICFTVIATARLLEENFRDGKNKIDIYFDIDNNLFKIVKGYTRTISFHSRLHVSTITFPKMKYGVYIYQGEGIYKLH